MQRSLIKCVVGLMALSALVGCSSGSGIEGETGTVTGKVTYKGNPLPVGSNVIMMHKGSGLIAVGVTDAEGKFQLMMRGEDQILTGEYSVGITPPVDAVAVNDSMDATPAAKETWDAVPEKYLTPETSGEKFTVTAGANDYQVDLKD